MAERVTILDVAKKAQVSKVTVSYVLNGHGQSQRISPVTEERVMAAARELGYRPNAIARMLARRKTDMLAVVFQSGEYFSFWSSFTSEVMKGVCDATVERGYDLMLHTKHVSHGGREADALADGRCDGALILRDHNDDTLQELIRRQLPCVQFFTRSDAANVPFVDSDNYSGGRMATRHLLELGHTNVLMVRGSDQSVSSNDRYNGYRDAMEGAGLRAHSLILESPTSPLDDFLNLMLAPERPTAIFVWSDDVAIGCISALRSVGLTVPDDVSIVGFDSTEAAKHSNPPLTSVHQPVFEMARQAALMLIDIIEEKPLERTQVLYPLTLHTRASTAARISTR